MNGFTGDAALSLKGLPADQGSASFAPATLTGGAGSSQLALTIPAGTYPLTIRATSGAISHTTAVSLVVPAPPDFSLSATPASAGTLAGGSGSSQLRVTTAGTLAPGGYPLTVTATSGSLSDSVSVTLVVTAAPDFTLAVTPASSTVTAGQSTSYTVTVSSVGGFAGSVALSVGSLPSAATGSFARTPFAAPGSTTLTIRTQRFTTKGTFTIKITGKSGSVVRQATATLVVRA